MRNKGLDLLFFGDRRRLCQRTARTHTLSRVFSQSIGGLSSQSAARFGNVLGVGGVALGLAATVGLMYHAGVPPEVFAQMAALMGVGGVAGYAVAGKVRFRIPRRSIHACQGGS